MKRKQISINIEIDPDVHEHYLALRDRLKRQKRTIKSWFADCIVHDNLTQWRDESGWAEVDPEPLPRPRS